MEKKVADRNHTAVPLHFSFWRNTSKKDIPGSMPVQKRHKLVSRESHPGNSLVNVEGVPVGGEKFVIMRCMIPATAVPCPKRSCPPPGITSS